LFYSISQEKISLILLFFVLWYLQEVTMKNEQTALSADFPAKLKDLRKKRGWSQGQLAQKIGADLQRISKYERGVIWPTMELTVKMAKVFDVSVDFLIRYDKTAAVSKIKNQKLLNKLEAINNLPEDDQETVISFLDAFIKRRKFEELVHE
jgi:transcriptional regulator with XRE-family HTH domain